MEYLKKIILIVIIIIIIVTIILIVINEMNKKEKRENFENTVTMEIANKIDFVDNRNEFYAVKSCITKYLLHLSQQDSEVIYAMLDTNYITSYNITNQNVISNIDEYNEPVFYMDKLYVIQDTQELYTYFAYGRVVDKQNSKTSNLNLVVRLNKENDLFSIIPYKYIEDNNLNIQIGSTVKLPNNQIKDNTYNKFSFKNITEEDMIVYYLSEIKDMMLYDIEASYNKLDNNYKQKKFANIQEYRNYINKNISKIYSAKVQKYDVKQYKDYTQYICIDQNENYYIINEMHIGEYNVILDTFTIDLPEYIEKYNKSNVNQKVAFCIDKFIKNINDENYNLAYGMVSQGFKNNYFKTLASFENYVKQNFLGKDKIEFKEFQNEKEIYIYKVILNSSKDSENRLEKSFNVKLGEGTQFEISFNVE